MTGHVIQNQKYTRRVLNNERFPTGNRITSESLVLPSDTDAFGGPPNSLDIRGSAIPPYDEQLARIDELNNELKLRRDIDALLNQFDDESQLSSVLDFCVSISSKKPEPCHEPE